VGTYEVRDLDAAKLARLMVGEEVKEFERTRDHKHQGNPVLVLKDLVRRGHYEDIHLSLWPGEVVGLAGLEGSGASALAKGLFGLEKRGGGSVSVKGAPFIARTPQEALTQGLAYLPQDRYQYGLVGLRPVRENITYPILGRLVQFLAFVNQSRENKLVGEYIQQLGIVTPSAEQTVSNLSGGNQQKVIFAKLAATRPNVLVLHEPTMGIDVQAKADIYRIVDDLSEQGVAILIISSEVRELLGVCDHILVMYEGRLTRDFVVGEPDATPENILLAIEGGKAHVQE
jgi:ABC-type sugar transport system ATPase subunit